MIKINPHKYTISNLFGKEKRKDPPYETRLLLLASQYVKPKLGKPFIGDAYNGRKIRLRFEFETGISNPEGQQKSCQKGNVDHIVPLEVGGNDDYKNMQYLGESVNKDKSSNTNIHALFEAYRNFGGIDGMTFTDKIKTLWRVYEKSNQIVWDHPFWLIDIDMENDRLLPVFPALNMETFTFDSDEDIRESYRIEWVRRAKWICNFLEDCRSEKAKDTIVSHFKELFNITPVELAME